MQRTYGSLTQAREPACQFHCNGLGKSCSILQFHTDVNPLIAIYSLTPYAPVVSDLDIITSNILCFEV